MLHSEVPNFFLQIITISKRIPNVCCDGISYKERYYTDYYLLQPYTLTIVPVYIEQTTLHEINDLTCCMGCLDACIYKRCHK